MRIMGFDVGSVYSGVALAEFDKRITSVTLAMTHIPVSAPEKLVKFQRWVQKYLSENTPSIIVAEDYAYGKGFFNKAVPELFGIFKAEVHKLNIPLLLIAPMTMKKLVAGSGRAKKPEVTQAVKDFVKSEPLELIIDTTYSSDVETRSHAYDALGLVICLAKAEEKSTLVKNLKLVENYYGVDLWKKIRKLS